MRTSRSSSSSSNNDYAGVGSSSNFNFENNNNNNNTSSSFMLSNNNHILNNDQSSPNIASSSSSSKAGRKRSKSSSRKRNEEIQPLLMNVGNEMNNLKDARAQFKLTCSMVLSVLILIINMLVMCLLTSVLVYVVSPVYVNHDVHYFDIGTIDSGIPSISPFRAASIDGNGKVYQGFGMGFSYSNTQMPSPHNISDGNTVSVSLFPAFQSVLLMRALVEDSRINTNNNNTPPSWDVTLNSMVLNQGKASFQPAFTFTIYRNQSAESSKSVNSQFEAFVHSGHYMYFFQKAKTATCLVTIERFRRNETNMMTVSIFGIVGSALSANSHLYTVGPFLINNYTFVDDGTIDYSVIRRTISMTAVQIDGNRQDLFVISHNFESNTCMYHSITSATEMTSNNLPQEVSCYSVDTANTQMIHTLQDSVIGATESHIFILGRDGKLVAIEPVPPCRKGYQIGSDKNADLTIHVKSLYVSQFIYSCHNSNDQSVSLLQGKLFSTNIGSNSGAYFLRLGTEYTNILQGHVESSWLTSALRDFKYQDISKEDLEIPIDEYHIFLTYARKEGRKTVLFTMKCTCPTISISTTTDVDNLFELDDYSPFCSIPFKHESINDNTISFGISSVKNFGIMITSFYYSSKSLILSTELANWQGGYKWIGITVPSFEQTSSNVVSVAQKGLVDIPSFVEEYLIEGASYYANIDGTVTRKRTPYYIGYAVSKKKLFMDSTFVQ